MCFACSGPTEQLAEDASFDAGLIDAAEASAVDAQIDSAIGLDAGLEDAGSDDPMFDAAMADAAMADAGPPAPLTFSAIAYGAPANRVDVGAAFDAVRGVTVMFGGASGDPAVSYLTWPLLHDTWEWDGTAWTERCTGECMGTRPSNRSSVGLAFDSARGVTVMFAGFAGLGATPAIRNLLCDAWTWDGTRWESEWTPASCGSDGPVAREGPQFSSFGARGVALYGGSANGLYLDDLWQWDGTRWMPLCGDGCRAAGHPPGMIFGTMVYDSDRDRLLVMGQTFTPDSIEIWEYDPSADAWTQLCTALTCLRTAPNPLPNHAHFGATYDSSRARMIAYGGFASPATAGGPFRALSHFYSWDGLTFHDEGEGTPRFEFGMAYDSVRHRSVAVGGFASGDTPIAIAADTAEIF